jgi:hypothetical protein
MSRCSDERKLWRICMVCSLAQGWMGWLALWPRVAAGRHPNVTNGRKTVMSGSDLFFPQLTALGLRNLGSGLVGCFALPAAAAVAFLWQLHKFSLHLDLRAM